MIHHPGLLLAAACVLVLLVEVAVVCFRSYRKDWRRS